MTSNGIGVDRSGTVLRLTINRPESRNALGDKQVQQLAREIATVGEGTTTAAVLLTGVRGAFCAGADLREVAQRGAPAALEMLDLVNELVAGIMACPVPTLAAVGGPAVGVGVSLALACDITVMSESAYFQLPFTGIGLMPDGGATALVAASVGRARAMRLALLGERLAARDALDWGMVTQVYSDETFDEAVEGVLGGLAQGATEALGLTAAAINAATAPYVAEAFTRERKGQDILSAAEPFTSVLERFKGRQ